MIAQQDDHPLGRLEAEDAVARHVDHGSRIVEGMLDREREQEQPVKGESDRMMRTEPRSGLPVVGPVKVAHNRPDDELIVIRFQVDDLRVAPILAPRVELLQEGAHQHRVVEIGVEARDGTGIRVKDVDHPAL